MREKEVERILNWKAPLAWSVIEVQIFIGFVNFYRRFIETFSKVGQPITGRLKTKEGIHLWLWGEGQNKPFEERKRRFTLAPIIVHFYPDQKTIIATDVSDFAVGCILPWYWGKWFHPVAFHSQRVNDTERNYQIHDKELLAILEALHEWKH